MSGDSSRPPIDCFQCLSAGAIRMDLSAIVSLLVSLVALAVSLVLVRPQLQQFLLQNKLLAQSAAIQKSELYLHLNARARELQSRMPTDINDADWKPTPEQWRTLELYWYLTFDIWAVTNKILREHDLWSSFYANGVRSALSIPRMREALDRLESSSFMGHRREFLDELRRCGLSATA